jgi:uncharacterized protein
VAAGTLSALDGLLVALAGLAAGTINGVIGSGTLITFPVLLAVGLSPVAANVTNCVGLVPGSVTAVLTDREVLRGQGRRAARLACGSAAGAAAGAVLFLALDERAVEVVVPVLIAAALVLVVLQPRIAARIRERRAPRDRPPGTGPGTLVGITGTGVYGGFFGAGQGIVLFALLGAALPDDLRRVTALRNLLAGTANAIGGLVFVVAADVDWTAALLIAAGAAVGGTVGARIARRLSPTALRGVVVAVGLAAIAQLVL